MKRRLVILGVKSELSALSNMLGNSCGRSKANLETLSQWSSERLKVMAKALDGIC